MAASVFTVGHTPRQLFQPGIGFTVTNGGGDDLFWTAVSGGSPEGVLHVGESGTFVTDKWFYSSERSLVIVDQTDSAEDSDANFLLGEVANVKNYGAVGDGVTDDSDAFQEAAADLTAGGTLYLPPCSGGYGWNQSSSGSISIPTGVTVLGSGYASRIVRIGSYTWNPSTTRVFVNADTTNGNDEITFDNLYFDGNSDSLTFPSTTLTVDATNGIGTLTVVSTSGFEDSGTLQLSRSHVHDRCTYTGKTATTFTGVTGVEGTISASGPAGTVAWDYENIGCSAIVVTGSNGNLCTRIRVKDCVFLDWPGIAVDLRYCEQFRISGQVLSNVLGGGLITRSQCSRGYIAHNTIDYNYDDAIAVNSHDSTQSERIVIHGNNVRKQETIYGQGNECVAIRGAKNVVVSHNTLSGPAEGGVDIRDGNSTGVSRVTVHHNHIIPDTQVSQVTTPTVFAAGIRVTNVSSAHSPYTAIRLLDNLITDGVDEGIRIKADNAVTVDGLYIARNTLHTIAGDGIAIDTGTFTNSELGDNRMISVSGSRYTGARLGQLLGPTTRPSAFGNPTATGNITVGTNNRYWIDEVSIPYDVTLTGIAYQVGGTSAGNVTVALYDTSGNKLVESNATALPGINQPHQVPFTATYQAKAGKLFKFITFTDSTAVVLGTNETVAANRVNGSGGAPSSLSVPSTPTGSTMVATTTY